jgi:hypothetical protein
MNNYSRQAFDLATRRIEFSRERWARRTPTISRNYERIQINEWTAVRADLLDMAHHQANFEDILWDVDHGTLEDSLARSLRAPQIAAQPVSLVKSTPGTYQSGNAHSIAPVYRNDLNDLYQLIILGY